LASWFSRGANILLGMMLLPILFRHLSNQELSVWLLLGQSWAALGIFDLGFGVILTRRIAFAMVKSPIPADGQMPKEISGEIADLVATGRRMYRLLAVLAFCVSFGLGATYLKSLELTEVMERTVWSAWGVLCLSQAVGIWSAPWTCLLQGVGYVGWDAIFGCVVNSLALLVQMALVLLGGGLMGLAIVAATGALAQRLLMVRFVRRRRSELWATRGRWSSSVLRGMIAPSLRGWLTSVGYMLLANTDQFFIASYEGTSAIPAYRAAFLLLINLHLLAGVFSAASPVFVSQLWQAGELGQIRAILRRNARVGLLAMGCGGGAILALGPSLFQAWLGGGNFAGYPDLSCYFHVGTPCERVQHMRSSHKRRSVCGVVDYCRDFEADIGLSADRALRSCRFGTVDPAGTGANE
jgi:O-antigen/teichoic acid export membrane protein